MLYMVALFLVLFVGIFFQYPLTRLIMSNNLNSSDQYHNAAGMAHYSLHLPLESSSIFCSRYKLFLSDRCLWNGIKILIHFLPPYT